MALVAAVGSFPDVSELIEAGLPASRLITHAFETSDGVRRFSRWKMLEQEVERSWPHMPWWPRLIGPPTGVITATETGERELRSLYGYWGKAFTLFFESAALGWAISWLAGRRWPQTTEGIFWFLIILSLVIGTLGLIAMAAGSVRRAVGAKRRFALVDRDHLASFLAGTQLTFVAGLTFGYGLYHGEARTVYGALAWVGVIGTLIHIGPLLLQIVVRLPDQSPQQIQRRIFGGIGFALIGILGGLPLKSEEPFPPESLEPLNHLLWLAPLAGIVLGVGGLSWLLHPFPPGLAFCRRTDRGLRRPLAFVAWTAILPLGGLAIPIWIYLRERYWPRLEREWFRDESNDRESSRRADPRLS